MGPAATRGQLQPYSTGRKVPHAGYPILGMDVHLLGLLQALYNRTSVGGIGTPTCVLDTRSFDSFQACRLQNSANLPLPYFTERCFLLPDKPRPLAVVDSPSQYTVVTDKADHGRQLADGSVAVYLNGAPELGKFLQSRGWNLQALLPDTPQLWQTAEQLGLLEGPVFEPHSLKRRWLFSPAPILEEDIPLIEGLICRHRGCSTSILNQDEQQQQVAAAAVQEGINTSSCNAGRCRSLACDDHAQNQTKQKAGCQEPGSCTAAGKLQLRALDLGCGSGRDLIWLACRHMDHDDEAVPFSSEGTSGCSSEQAKCTAPQQQEQVPEHRQQQQQVHWKQQQQAADWDPPGKQDKLADELITQQQPNKQLTQQQQQQGKETLQHTEGQQQQGEGYLHSMKQRQQHVIWSVMGVDEWHGALVRAQHLAQLACLPQEQVQLLLAKVDPATGELQQMPLPKSSPLEGWGPSGVTAGDCGSAAVASSASGAPMAPVVAGEGKRAVGGSIASSGCGGESTSAGLPEPGSYDLVLCVRFLERAALPYIAKLLRPGGCVAYSTFVEGPGLAAFGRPSGRERVLGPQELGRDWFGQEQGFSVVRDEIVLSGDGRELSYFIAQKM